MNSKIAMSCQFHNGHVIITQFTADEVDTALLTIKVHKGENDTLWLSLNDLDDVRTMILGFLKAVKDQTK